MLAQGAHIYFRRKNGCFKYAWWPVFLNGYSITEQSWLFLFNVGSGVHLRLAVQQGTGTEINWNIPNIASLLLFMHDV